MKNIEGFNATILALGVCCSLTSGQAWGQAAAPTNQDVGASQALEEIVVTARRQEEAAQVVPMAIEAISGNKLEQLSIKSSLDLDKISSGLTVAGGTNSRSITFTVRGQSTLTYFDDVGTFGAQSLYDLDNIQVLKGPQGVAFGKSNTGGAVLLVTRKPTNDFEGYVDTRYGNYNDHEVEGAVNIPIISDKVLLRLAGQGRWRDGYVNNLYDGAHYDGLAYTSGRATLVLRPAEDLENTTVLSYTYNDYAVGAKVIDLLPLAQYSGVSIPGLTAMPSAVSAKFGFAPGTTWYQALQYYFNLAKQSGPFTVNTSGPHSTQDTEAGGVNTTTYDVDLPWVGATTFKNIVGYNISSQVQAYEDVDWTPLPLLKALGGPPDPENRSYRFSEEPQILGKLFDDKLRYTIGGYWETDWSPRNQANSQIVLGTLTITPQQAKKNTRAAYIDVSYDVSDSVSVEGGVRNTRDHSVTDTGSKCSFAYGVTPQVCNAPVVSHTSFEGQAVSYAFGLDWRIDQGLMAYVSHRDGYLQGGVNNIAALPQFAVYGPQFAKDIEGGVKWDWDYEGIKGRTDADIFHTWYIGIQESVRVSAVVNGLLVAGNGITNAASGEYTGLELEQTVVPSPWFDVRMDVTWMQGGFDSWNNPALGTSAQLKDSLFQFTPRWKFVLMPVLHVLPLEAYGEVTLSGALTYSSKYMTQAGNNLGNQLGIVNGFALLDMRLDWKVMDTGLTASIACTNCVNRIYRGISTNEATAGILTTVYGEPQMYFAELKYKF